MPGSSGAPWEMPFPTLTDVADGPDMVKDVTDRLTDPATGVLGEPWVQETAPTGKIGRMWFQPSTGKLLQYYDPPGVGAAGWYRPWNTPWGRLGMFAIGVSGFVGATMTSIGGSTITAVTVDGRRVRAWGTLRLVTSGTATVSYAQLTLEGTAGGEYGVGTSSQSQSAVSPVHELTSVGVNVDWALAIRADGGGTVRSEAGLIFVDDVGPA